MNKAELIDAIGKEARLTKADAERGLNALIDTIKNVLGNGDEVTIPGFGTFKIANRAERSGRNPRTGEVIHIPASKLPAFKVSKVFKDTVNK